MFHGEVIVSNLKFIPILIKGCHEYCKKTKGNSKRPPRYEKTSSSLPFVLEISLNLGDFITINERNYSPGRYWKNMLLIHPQNYQFPQ